MYEIQAAFGELFRVPQPATLEHLKSVIHAKIGRVSYESAANHAWSVPFCSTLETCAKLIQNLYNASRPPTANHRISAPSLRPKLARKHTPAAPQFPPIFDQKCNIPIGTFFCNILRPFFALLLSGQEPQKQKCYTFAENATPSRPLFAPSAAAPKDRPSAIEKTNRSPPQNLYKTPKPAHRRPPP